MEQGSGNRILRVVAILDEKVGVATLASGCARHAMNGTAKNPTLNGFTRGPTSMTMPEKVLISRKLDRRVLADVISSFREKGSLSLSV